MPTDTPPLAGQHAIITGGGRGIGAVIAGELARLGARLTLLGRNEATLSARRDALIAEHGSTIHLATVDVSDEASVQRAFATAIEAFGTPSILINNAGAASSAPLRRTTLADWNAMLAVNLTGAFLCSRAVVPGMTDAGYGRIVNVASTAGLKGYAYVAPYVAAKHGLIGLTRALAVELARTGITVNAVCPGFTDTDLLAESIGTIVASTGRTPDDARARLTRANPQGRLIDPSEVAQAVVFLCLPGSSSITGQALVVAGGEVM